MNQMPNRPGSMGPPPPGHPANMGPQGNPNFPGSRGPQNPNRPGSMGPPRPGMNPNFQGNRGPQGMGSPFGQMPRGGFRPNDMRNPSDTLPGPGIFTGQVGEGRGASDWNLSMPDRPNFSGPHMMQQEAEDTPREAESQRSRRQVTPPTPWHKGTKN